jgi:hypothetical protein
MVARYPAIAASRLGLAQTCIDYGQWLGDSGLAREKKRLWFRALDLLAGLVGEFPETLSYQGQWLDHLNNLAWLLATDPDPVVSDPALAVSWSEQAVQHAPENPVYWNSLGVARYKAGDDRGAIEALKRSVDLGSGGTSFDHFYLALAFARSGEHASAQLWYDQGVSWMEGHRPRHGPLLRLREEAATQLFDSAPQPVVSLMMNSLEPPRQVTGSARDDSQDP